MPTSNVVSHAYLIQLHADLYFESVLKGWGGEGEQMNESKGGEGLIACHLGWYGGMLLRLIRHFDVLRLLVVYSQQYLGGGGKVSAPP